MTRYFSFFRAGVPSCRSLSLLHTTTPATVAATPRATTAMSLRGPSVEAAAVSLAVEEEEEEEEEAAAEVEG